MLLVAVVMASMNGLMAQKIDNKDVPKHITAAHSSKFPDGKIRHWERSQEGYLVRFQVDGKNYQSSYGANGAWQSTESVIKRTKSLPQHVKEAWAKSGHYDWYVNEIRAVQTPDREVYIMHVNNGPTLDANKYDAFLEHRLLYFGVDGTLISNNRI